MSFGKQTIRNGFLTCNQKQFFADSLVEYSGSEATIVPLTHPNDAAMVATADGNLHFAKLVKMPKITITGSLAKALSDFALDSLKGCDFAAPNERDETVFAHYFAQSSIDILRDRETKSFIEREFRATKGQIHAIAKRHHKWVDEMGWHNKTVLENLALVASEVGEAVNECRGAEPTAKFGEELADIVLRTMDLAVIQGVDLQDEILKKMAKNNANGTRGRKF